MARIIISQNITLDGVVHDPTGEQGRPGGGWFHRISPGDRAAWTEESTAEAMNASALLMGRRSYEYFAARWPARTGVWADRLSALPKYVVTAGLDDLTWANSTPVPIDEVAKLKHTLDGDVFVNGSAQLAHALLEQDLADELRLIVFPALAGAGDRIYPQRELRLLTSRTIGENLLVLAYEPAREA
jgi:dihydrofolate reductase